MNRDRLTILRDHLASLPDERVDMRDLGREDDCGTVACIAGWACKIFPNSEGAWCAVAEELLSLDSEQGSELFAPNGYETGRYTRSDAIAAIQSMLDSPDDDALPVWPSREGASA